MSLIYIVIWSFVLIAGVSSVAALAWSIRTGQWRGTSEDAGVIFNLDDSQSPSGKTSAVNSLSTRGE